MRRKSASIQTLAVVALLMVCSACGYQQKPSSAPAPPEDTRAADESAIRAQALEWAKAAAAKDLEKTLSFYADDAAMFPPNVPIAATKEARRQLWSAFMATPGYALEIKTSKVEAARSGDLAYETGVYSLTLNDKKGKPATTNGKYVVVWKKQADSGWKAVADIFNADQ